MVGISITILLGFSSAVLIRGGQCITPVRAGTGTYIIIYKGGAVAKTH